MRRSLQFSKMPSLRPLANTLLIASGFLALVGFADAAYLTAKHYFDIPLPCSITHGCETVLHSPYSMVGPIPLALFGVGFYLVVLFAATALYTSGRVPKLFRIGFFLLTLAGFVMSVIFMSIQIFLIHAICQYCALSALVSTLLFLCGLWYFRAERT